MESHWMLADPSPRRALENGRPLGRRPDPCHSPTADTQSDMALYRYAREGREVERK